MEKNEELENSINQIIKKIKQNKGNESYDNIQYLEFYNLITENIQNQKNITFIFHIISRAIANSDNQKEKESLFKLLPEFFIPFKNNISKTFPFISRILTTIQSNIHSNINFEYVSKIFKGIIQLLFNFNDNIDESQNKINYEICQGFCIYNMKQNDEFCQNCGVLCLRELIINLNFFLKNNKYMKYLWEKLILFIENDNFGNKLYLLQCFSELINKCKEKFKQFSNITLYKILDFLQDNNIELRKETLNILYLLIYYCPNGIETIKNQLIDFISFLEDKKNEFIKMKCNQILKLLKDNDYNKNTLNHRKNSENKELKNKINEMKLNVKNLNENNIINNNSNENIIQIDHLILNQKPNNRLIKNEKESIFNTPKNQEFFKKANQIEDIYIVDPLHNLNLQQQNTIEEDYENQNQSSIYNYRKLSKDYSYNSIINTNNNYNNNNNILLTYDSHNLESNLKKNQRKYSKDDYYSQLIQKMFDLSDKQVFLIDCITQLKNDFYNVTTDLNNRIEKLEKIISNGTPILTNNSIYMNQINNSNINNYLKNPIQNLIDENNMNSLLMNISKFNFEDLNEIPIQTLENVIYYLINKIQKEKNIPLDKIISTFKKIIIGIKNIEFSNQCIENLENILKILSTDLNISESNLVEIKLILSYLKKIT